MEILACSEQLTGSSIRTVRATFWPSHQSAWCNRNVDSSAPGMIPHCPFIEFLYSLAHYILLPFSSSLGAFTLYEKRCMCTLGGFKCLNSASHSPCRRADFDSGVIPQQYSATCVNIEKKFPAHPLLHQREGRDGFVGTCTVLYCTAAPHAIKALVLQRGDFFFSWWTHLCKCTLRQQWHLN